MSKTLNCVKTTECTVDELTKKQWSMGLATLNRPDILASSPFMGTTLSSTCLTSDWIDWGSDPLIYQCPEFINYQSW